MFVTLFIRVRPPKDFGPKAQNLERERTRLRICGMEIISLKNRKKIHSTLFSPKLYEMFAHSDSVERNSCKNSQKIGKKYICPFFCKNRTLHIDIFDNYPYNKVFINMRLDDGI